MRALVTGSAGFIGSQVRNAFDDAGYRTDGLDIVNGSRYDVRAMPAEGMGHYDVVVHCAAVVGGRRLMDWTPIAHARNLATDAALFEWAAATRPGRVVYFSSSCAYPAALGNAAQPLAEDDISLRHPQWPDQLYGWAKLTGELLAQTVAGEGIPVTVVRPFSVYGPGANQGFAVRGFLDQAAGRADPFVIWGSDEQVRDYIHVADVAEAVTELVRQDVSGPVNLGTGQGTSLAELAEMTCAAAGYQPQVKVNESMPAGYPYLVADNSRLLEHYKPRRRVQDYVREVAALL